MLRLLLATLPGFPTDVGFFRSWAEAIASAGPDDFYAPGTFHDYAPGYMWVLWLFGELDEIFGFSDGQWDYLLKLPSIVADLGSAYLLYVLLSGRTVARPFGAVALYLLFPPVLLIGAVWGQVDSILAFLVILTIYLLVRDRPVAAAVSFSLAFLVKPQAIAVLPFFAFWILRDRFAWRDVRTYLRLSRRPGLLLRMVGASLATTLVVVFPFFPSLLLWRPFVDLAHQVRNASETYKLTAFFAYNWWEVVGSDRCDVSTCRDPTTGAVTHGEEYLGLTARSWGVLLFVLSVTAVIVALRNARGIGFLALGTSLSILAFFVFMTRMHERYLFPFFLPFLVACVLLRSRALWTAFVLLGTAHFLNLYFVYVNAEGTALRSDRLYEFLRDGDLWGMGFSTTRLLACVVVACLVGLLAAAYRLSKTSPVPGTGRG